MDKGKVHQTAGLCVLLLAFVLAGNSGVRLTAPISPNVLLATVQVDLSGRGRVIPDDFDGLAAEYQGIQPYLGASPNAPNKVFRQLLRNLGPGTLRIGGTSTDSACWNPSHILLPPNCAFAVDHNTLSTVFQAAQAVHWRVIIGVNLARNDARSAVAYAHEGVVAAAPSRTLLGLEIGNEPDLYPTRPYVSPVHAGPIVYTRSSSYSFPQYLREFNSYSVALGRDPTTRVLPLMGPSVVYSFERQLGSFAMEVAPHRLEAVTVHYYPLNICTRHAAARATISNLLGQPTMDSMIYRIASFVAMTRAAHQRLQLDELNTVACGGQDGISNSFASALWGLDALFRLAETGVEHVNFHSGQGLDAYDPITSSADYAPVTHRWSYTNAAQPLYYAMLLFSRAAGRSLLPTAVVGTAANIEAYTVTDGMTTRVFLINKDLKAHGRVTIVPSHPLGAATALVLKASTLGATTGTTLGGQTIGGTTGIFPTPTTTALYPDARTHSYTVDLPIASAVMLSIASSPAYATRRLSVSSAGR